MMDPTQQAPAAGAPQAAAPQQPGGDQQAPAICVQMQPDGTYLVYSEDTGPDAGQPAQDVDSALQLVKQMLEGGPDGDADQNGGAPDGDADDAAEQLFQSGFSGARGALGR